MAVSTRTRPDVTVAESPVRIHEIDEALTWSAAIPKRDRDRFWRLWCDRLLDQRLRLTQCNGPASTARD